VSGRAVRGKGRLQRGTLSREVIVAAALRILDVDGADGLTFNRLGAELSASPTAVYRHFSSRVDIVIAIADELDRISLDGYAPHEDWRESLRDLALRAWRTTLDHPAAAALCMGRVTRGIHELRAVDAVLEAIHRAGWQGREAVLQYQAYSNWLLSVAALHGARMVQEAADGGPEGWVQEYHPVDPAAYPYAEAAKEYLRQVDHTEVFRRQVEIIIAAISTETPQLTAATAVTAEPRPAG
jgi:AcrR family transcriptional regulator